MLGIVIVRAMFSKIWRGSRWVGGTLVGALLLVALPAAEGATPLTISTLQGQVRSGITAKSPGAVLPSVKSVLKGPAWTFVGNTLVTKGCNPRQTPSLITQPKPCNFGNPRAKKTVVLVGASHAGMWMPAFKSMSSTDFYQLKAFIYPGCPPLLVDFTVPPFDRDSKYVTANQCATWNANVATAINALHPDAVIVSGGSQSMTTGPGVLSQWVNGMSAFLNSFTAPKKIIIGSTPLLNITTEMAKCVNAHASNVAICNTTYNAGSNSDITKLLLDRDAQVAAATGATLVPVISLVCTPTSNSSPIATCPAVINHNLVYVDDNHLSAVFVTYITPVFRSLINVPLKS